MLSVSLNPKSITISGITDTFLRPKPGVVPHISHFNARSILIQDGLLLSYSSGDALVVDISLSNFAPEALPADTELAWSVHVDGKSIKGNSGVKTRPVAQGSLGVVASIEVTLPDVGTSESVRFGATDGPKTVTLTAQLTGNAFEAGPEQHLELDALSEVDEGGVADQAHPSHQRRPAAAQPLWFH